jgi:hypothetical protein
MKNKTIKKSFEQEDDICNLFSEAEKQKNFIPNNLERRLQKSAKRSNSRNNNSRISRNSTKDSPMNLSVSQTTGNPNVLVELVESLKDKLALYENEIKSLLDEKVQMQMTINNLQMTRGKKNSKSGSISNNESVAELNKQYVREVSGLNHQLKSLDENIQRQRNLIEQHYSILDDTNTDIVIGSVVEQRVK